MPNWWIVAESNMNKRTLIVGGVIFFAMIGYLVWSNTRQNPKITEFAKCLADKNAVMYGAYWCPHCQNQKRLFGNSFEYVKYVECTEEIKLCEEKGIKGYPTWIFENGERVEGQMSFSQLADKTLCTVP